MRVLCTRVHIYVSLLAHVLVCIHCKSKYKKVNNWRIVTIPYSYIYILVVIYSRSYIFSAVYRFKNVHHAAVRKFKIGLTMQRHRLFFFNSLGLKFECSTFAQLTYDDIPYSKNARFPDSGVRDEIRFSTLVNNP